MTDFHWAEKLTPEQYREFYAFYSKEWWTRERSFEDVIHMLDNCDVLVFCFDDAGNIAGFARVLSDFTFKATIFDVIVSDHHRGQGLGQGIVKRVLAHKKLERVKSFELYCPDRLVPFYEKLGFGKGTSALLFNQP